MIQHESTGWLVPPADAESLAKTLALAIENQGLRAEYGKAGRARCENVFSLSVHTENALSLYRQVLLQRTVA